jgi:hypothetical protein
VGACVYGGELRYLKEAFERRRGNQELIGVFERDNSVGFYTKRLSQKHRGY